MFRRFQHAKYRSPSSSLLTIRSKYYGNLAICINIVRSNVAEVTLIEVSRLICRYNRASIVVRRPQRCGEHYGFLPLSAFAGLSLRLLASRHILLVKMFFLFFFNSMTCRRQMTLMHLSKLESVASGQEHACHVCSLIHPILLLSRFETNVSIFLSSA